MSHPLPESLGVVWCLVLAYTGCAAIAFAMDRHRSAKTNSDDRAHKRQILRLLGALALLLAIWPCMAAWGASIGLVAWFGLVMTSSYALTLLLRYAPRTARHAAVATTATAIILTFIASISF